VRCPRDSVAARGAIVAQVPAQFIAFLLSHTKRIERVNIVGEAQANHAFVPLSAHTMTKSNWIKGNGALIVMVLVKLCRMTPVRASFTS
jgi:hypothetical protein